MNWKSGNQCSWGNKQMNLISQFKSVWSTTPVGNRNQMKSLWNWIKLNQDSEDWELHLANCVLQDFCQLHDLHNFFSESGTKACIKINERNMERSLFWACSPLTEVSQCCLLQCSVLFSHLIQHGADRLTQQPT